MSTTVGAPPLPCAEGVSNLVSPGGRQNGGFQASPPRRGMRTTLVNGVRTLNEVETSPRHHVQRRAELVYLRGGPIVKKNVARQGIGGEATASRSWLRAPSRVLVSSSATARSSRWRNSSSAM